MRTVTASRDVPASIVAVDRALSPAAIIEAEGTFTVVDVAEREDGATVTGRASGITATFTFEPLEDGYRYEQEGEAGPFDHMETVLTRERATTGSGSRLTARSTVSLGLPLPALSDRVAGWKRRGELRRLLETLEDECR